MQSIRYRLIEFFVVFVLIPMSFVFNFQLWVKLAIGVSGFIYVIYVLLKVENNKFKIRQHINWTQFWQRTTIKFLVIALVTIGYMYIIDYKNLFVVIKSKPLL